MIQLVVKAVKPTLKSNNAEASFNKSFKLEHLYMLKPLSKDKYGGSVSLQWSA